MNLKNYIKECLVPLDISLVKKETIINLISNYELSEAQKILNSCISQNETVNGQLLILIAEIEKHIELFNDDLESDEIFYND